MESFTNDKGEEVVIAEMENPRLIHSIAKYAELQGKGSIFVTGLKAEAMRRLADDSE